MTLLISLEMFKVQTDDILARKLLEKIKKREIKYYFHRQVMD